MFFVGVDLTSAFSQRPRALDIAVLDDELRCSFQQGNWPERRSVIDRDPEVLWRMIASRIPNVTGEQVWALDGPQGLASVGAKVRRCELALGTPGRTPDVLPATDSSAPFQGYIRSSVDLFTALLNHQSEFRLGGAGEDDLSVATLFEVFPGAEWTVLTGKRLPKKTKEQGRSARLSLFKQLDIRGLSTLPTADQNDALVGAYLAWCSRHNSAIVRLVGSPALAEGADCRREGKILHAAGPAVLDDAQIEASPETDGAPPVEIQEQEEDWASGDSSQVPLIDTGLVHGTVPENRWLDPGEDYVCETLPPDPVHSFHLTHSTTFAGGRGWTCRPTIPILLKSLRLASHGNPSKERPVGLRLRVVSAARDDDHFAISGYA